MTERQAPFYCPYCGEENLRPSGPEAGGWECGACLRAFRLSFAGVTPPSTRPDGPQPAPGRPGGHGRQA